MSNLEILVTLTQPDGSRITLPRNAIKVATPKIDANTGRAVSEIQFWRGRPSIYVKESPFEILALAKL